MSVEKVGQQLRRVVHQRYHLFVGHASRSDDANYPRQGARVILRGDHGEVAQPFIFVFSAYGNRNSRRLTALAERSEEHTSELQSQSNLVCRLLLEKKKN